MKTIGPAHSLNIFRILKESPDVAEIVRITGIIGPDFTRDILRNALIHLTLFEAGYSNNEDIKKQIVKAMGLETSSSDEPGNRNRSHLSVVKGPCVAADGM